jgi:hypothetical protein
MLTKLILRFEADGPLSGPTNDLPMPCGRGDAHLAKSVEDEDEDEHDAKGK